MNTFGNNVKRIREAKGLSQDELAKRRVIPVGQLLVALKAESAIAHKSKSYQLPMH